MAYFWFYKYVQSKHNTDFKLKEFIIYLSGA